MGSFFATIIGYGAPLFLISWGGYAIYKKEFRFSFNDKLVFRGRTAIYLGIFMLAVGALAYLTMLVYLIDWWMLPKHES